MGRSKGRGTEPPKGDSQAPVSLQSGMLAARATRIRGAGTRGREVAGRLLPPSKLAVIGP